jgi:response regulator RpfG family c-di-GMP phosphodiesterase
MLAGGDYRIIDKLVADGLITPEQQEATLNWIRRTGDRPEEALLEVEALEEGQLLRFLATLHRTRFVSTEKLARAEIDRFVLEMVPKKVAERDGVFPVMYDDQGGVLSVVTSDPGNLEALDNVRIASGAKQVRAFLGRPKAVRAAINKAYNGDIHAFALLDRAAHEQIASMLDVFERNLVTEESLALSLANEGASRERMLSPEDLERGVSTAPSSGIASESFLEALNVLITLLENSRPDLRGHSAHVARLVKKIAERIGLSEIERGSILIAAYLHDLGKMGAYHLTALNVAEYEAHRASAAKLYNSPLRMMETVQLSREVAHAVETMYERYDGKGLPGGASGKDIPLGGRLLAIADTYTDLTQNPRNPYRKKLRPTEACEVLAKYSGGVFDPNLVDLFRHTVTGEDLKARLLANRHRALIVDADPEETTLLELRLLEQGFEVRSAHTAEQALKILDAGDIEIVCCEIDLRPIDGFALFEQVRKKPWGQNLPWIVLSGRPGRAEAQRAFELGASDVMTKPVSADLLVAKMKQLLERQASASGARGRGVNGSLSEMGLPDMVQVLWHGRKTGSLRIRSGQTTGEIHFVNGNVYNALWRELRGEEAFYEMLGLVDGDFSLDPNFQAPQQVISDSPEALLLEGMRRLDEQNR